MTNNEMIIKKLENIIDTADQELTSGFVYEKYGLDVDSEFFITRMNTRYGLNKITNSAGRKMKQTGEYFNMRPIYELPFFDKGPVYVMVYLYLCSLMIRDPEGGWKTKRTEFLIDEMVLKFKKQYTYDEVYNAFTYLINEKYLYLIYNVMHYPAGKDDPNRVMWITAPEVIYGFEAMMQEKNRKHCSKAINEELLESYREILEGMKEANK